MTQPKEIAPIRPSLLNSEDPETVFELTKKIGKGGYGEVYKAIYKPTGKLVAVKVMEIESEVDARSVEEEIKLIKAFDSPFVVKYYGSYFKHEKLWIAIEYCDAGSCLDIIKKQHRPFNEKQIRCVMKQVVQGVAYIHGLKPPICHRDIKAGNILLNARGEAKLADFGISAQITATMRKLNTQIGSPYWMAPEVLSEEKYDLKVDIWALAITAIELAQGKPPWFDQGALRALFLISTKPPPTLAQPELWSASFNNFLDCCLVRDSSKRATAQELLKHPFLTEPVDPTELTSLLMDVQNVGSINEHSSEFSEWPLQDISDESLSDTESSAKSDGKVSHDLNPSPPSGGNISWMEFLRDTKSTPMISAHQPPAAAAGDKNRQRNSHKANNEKSRGKQAKKDKKRGGIKFWKKEKNREEPRSVPPPKPTPNVFSNPPSPPIPFTTSDNHSPSSSLASSPHNTSSVGLLTPTPSIHRVTSAPTSISSLAGSSHSSGTTPTPISSHASHTSSTSSAFHTTSSALHSTSSAVRPTSSAVHTTSSTFRPTATTSSAAASTSSPPTAATATPSAQPQTSIPNFSDWFTFFTNVCGLAEDDARVYVQLFQENELEINQALDLNTPILRELGVKVGHLIKIMKQVRALQQASEAAT